MIDLYNSGNLHVLAYNCSGTFSTSALINRHSQFPYVQENRRQRVARTAMSSLRSWTLYRQYCSLINAFLFVGLLRKIMLERRLESRILVHPQTFSRVGDSSASKTHPLRRRQPSSPRHRQQRRGMVTTNREVEESGTKVPPPTSANNEENIIPPWHPARRPPRAAAHP